MRHAAWFVLIALSVGHGLGIAQDTQSAAPLIDASISNADINAKNALRYTFRENESYMIPDTGAPPTPRLPGSQWTIPVYTVNSEYRWSVQRDVLFIEGIPYRRVTAVNDQKLPPDIAASESESYDRAVTAIHALSPQQRQQYLSKPEGRPSIAFDPRSLKDSYVCKVTGHQGVDKRPATVILCRPVRKCQNSDVPNHVNGPVTLWIDNDKPFFHRTRTVLDCPIQNYGVGTTFTDTWSFIEGVWHETSAELSWIGKGSTIKNVDTTSLLGGSSYNLEQTSHGTTISKFSNFKKFRTESKIVIP